jgi:hypothetical protein
VRRADMPSRSSLSLITCGARCRPAWTLGNGHGLVAIPPAALRLGRLPVWLMSMSANGCGTGIDSRPQ